jgi:hypothetical protein
MSRWGVPEQKVIGAVPDIGSTVPAVIEVTVIPALADAVHPRGSVVVTEYVIEEDGETVIAAVVAPPGLHK